MTPTAPHVSMFHQQAPDPADSVEIVVTLPTFRRPEHLVKTLKTVLSQQPGCPFAIVVMENDAEGLAGAHAARDFFLQHRVNALIVVAHDRGNCHAYNAGWTAALSSYPQMKALAVIDDDEVAAPSWLENLISVHQQTGADLVGGPQLPDFEDKARSALKQHPVFTPHYDTSGPVPILYSSGNVLISSTVLRRMPTPFLDPAFNFTGGGDSDFYRRCRAEGFCFAWANDAWVTETIPARRTEGSWIRARSLRTGALSAQLAHRARPGLAGRIRTIGHSLLLLAASPFRGLTLWRRTGVAPTVLFHFHVAIGRLMAEFGLINEQYRNPEKN
ncbi:glycosyltransferase involved in cell wall biosynthesis [Pararhizobium capsulatum DSM 1112]|uniref:Glycosyltransferase involved in cell wall biosynthesis n=1 Tax=Pararhizobium capsulatum DSM 1112 TaxID=1121113 RepID=A0ABU0BLS1_9HYPH|nr:glycosyltransferase family 2 protein [Pararhizobium capsulatum]MDQ0319182.1 glycosyltransferase involved in cell wall biosynthesis [Pararhizobium capsulatum DSM 1112]